jgi:polysaccharide chain length determinant protein (PEP-CTERM system associated)
MHESLSQLLLTARGMWRYRWPALACAWVIALLGWTVTLLLPNTYEARAKVFVDTESVLKPLLRGLAPETDVMSQVTMMSRALLSEPQLKRAARETDLYLRARNEKELEKLIERMRLEIKLTGDVANQNLYTISYTDVERVMALRVVQKLLDNFVESTLGVNRQDSSNAQEFIEAQIREYEKKLLDAENKLAEFKRANVGLMPGAEGDYYTRMQTAMNKLTQLKSDYDVTVQKRDAAARELEGEDPTFGLFDTQETTPYDAQIRDHEQKLDKLLLNYTEKHPEVIALQESITKLKEEREKSKLERKPPPIPQGAEAAQMLALSQLNVNPVYQRFKVQMKEAEIELASLRTRIADTQSEVAKLRSMVDTIPRVEAELAQLNRDYEVNKQKHTQLLQALEAAKLAGQVEQSRDDVKFRIIEPPLALLAPVGPPRLLFIIVVLLGALAAGGALALVLHQINPVFLTRQTLQQAIQLPVLGSVSMFVTPGEQAKRRARDRTYAIAASLLLVAFAGALVVAQFSAGAFSAAAGTITQ